MKDAGDQIIDLAREGYTVILSPSPVGEGGLEIRVQGGALHAHRIIHGAQIDQHRGDVVALMLEQIQRDIGDALEREVRGE